MTLRRHLSRSTLAIFTLLACASGCTYSKSQLIEAPITQNDDTDDGDAPPHKALDDVVAADSPEIPIAQETPKAEPAQKPFDIVWYVTDVKGMEEGSPDVEYNDFDCSSANVKPDTCEDPDFGVIDQITIANFQTAKIITGFTCGKIPEPAACSGPYKPEEWVMANSTQDSVFSQPRGLDVKQSAANQGLADIQMVGTDTPPRDGYDRVACADGYDFVGIRQGRPDEGTYYYGAICRLRE